MVTGAAGGIGMALAAGVAREGASVVCVDKDAAGAARGADEIGAAGGRSLAIGADLSDFAQVERVLTQAVDFMGSVDALFANAGGSRGETVPFLDLEPSIWWEMVNRNLTTAFNCGLVFARQMASGAGGAIVFTSSQLSEVTRPGLAHYAASKGAIRQLVKGMAVDLAEHGIRVNAIAPGTTETPGNRAYFARPDVAEVNRRLVPMGRVADPVEMVGAAVFLASEEASYVTGATLFVDGGYTCI
ncbi:MAG TPA: SDR family oxidoreductase [Candidatus Acidoferrales bacterium]|nr:SDR family oxidoreductase [Candidatus Acidoferrales bacterium]